MRQWSNIAPRNRRTVSAHSPGMVHCNAMELISQDHSSGEQVVIVHGNTGWRADDESKPELSWRGLDQMQRCLERHGYKVTKPKKVKASKASPSPTSEP
ncbi:hypothetical protein SB2_11970 [Methylobacterium radiotolerans]|nr:hypothetical protein SB2_11970 [Methylobacterium radiotolerans]